MELCRSVHSDPWGVPYRLVTKRLGRRFPALDQNTTLNVACGLFPLLPLTDWDCIPMNGTATAVLMNLSDIHTYMPLFTIDEVARAVAKLPSGKAPGPDLVQTKMIGLAFLKFPECFV